MPIHLHGNDGDVAPVVILPGDPGRTERIAERLEDVVCYTRYRGLLGFTGRYNGARISVQTTGMGGPSTAIVAEELIQLGATTLIRAGTAGALGEQVQPGDLLVATASIPLDGTTVGLLGGRAYAPAADFAVVRALEAATARAGGRRHIGLALTDDVFYHPSDAYYTPWVEFGALAVEMEASALFTVAAQRGVRAGALLTISNFVGSADWLDPVMMVQAVDTMIGCVLDAAVALSA